MFDQLIYADKTKNAMDSSMKGSGTYFRMGEAMKIYINGRYCEKAEAAVSMFDHGLLYGDGVFEGLRIYGGKVFRLEAHLERLYRCAKAILLEIPMSRAHHEVNLAEGYHKISEVVHRINFYKKSETVLPGKNYCETLL